MNPAPLARSSSFAFALRLCFVIASAFGLMHLANAQSDGPTSASRPAPVSPSPEWPQFRGPSGQGHAIVENLPLHWSDMENVVWKRAIPGQGWSSPAYSGGQVYLTTAVDLPSGGYSLRALAIDATSGHIQWDHEIFQEPPSAPRIHQKNSHASPTPVIEDNRVYVHFGHQGTACLDASGQILWRNSKLGYSPVHGNGGSPILAGNALIFSADGGQNPFVAALDKNNGELLWKTSRETDTRKTFSFSTPLLIEVNGVPQVISPGSNMVAAYDPKTGTELWRVRYDGYSVIPRPVYGHGMIFIGTGYDRPSVMAIRVDGRGDVTDSHVVWTTKRGAPNTPSLLLVEQELYMVSDGGIASCLDALSGETHWQERVGGNYSASPIFGAGRIYLQNEEGTGTVLASGKVFEKLAVNDLNERTLASYAATEGTLFIRTAEHLYRIGKHAVERNL